MTAISHIAWDEKPSVKSEKPCFNNAVSPDPARSEGHILSHSGPAAGEKSLVKGR
jgi:hypothetical protein